MSEQLFRQKSLDKVRSPENLDDYIRVSSPGVWLLLVSVLILLLGACVWGIFGHVDSTADADVHAEDGAVVCTVDCEAVSSLQTGMIVKFGGFEAVIDEVRQEGSGYVCTLRAEQSIPDGFYEGEIVIERIKPLSFILN